MLNGLSPRVQDCYRRADACARRADVTDCAEQRKYWHKQEAHWILIAAYCEFSERVGSFLKSGWPHLSSILWAEGAGLDALVDIFNRVCTTMNIDPQNESVTHIITQTLVTAVGHGERDAEVLYYLAVQAIT
jgi:hypothetical protein